MFHSQNLLSGKGPLGTIWVAAYFHKKLKKAQITQTDISSSVDKILEDVLNVITYRVLAYFLLGVVRIYSRKVEYLFDDCNKVLNRIDDFVVSGKGKLLIETKRSPFHSIKRPKRFELDAFDLGIVVEAIGDGKEDSQELKISDDATKYKCSSSGKYHREKLVNSHMTCSTDCTFVDDVHSSQPDEIDMEVDTLCTKSNFEIWGGNLEERFCQEDSVDLENISETVREDNYIRNNNVNISETEQQESRTEHIHEENHDLNKLEGSIEKLLDDGCHVEQHIDDMISGTQMNSVETGKQSLEEQHKDLEQMKLQETPMFKHEKFTDGIKSNQETLDATPQSRSRRASSTKSRQGAGAMSPQFMLIPTPAAIDRTWTSRKRKCLVDDMTVLSNEVLKNNIHDSSNLIRKRRKVSVLAGWKSDRLANLSQAFLEPLVPCIPPELKSLYRTDNFNISVSVECGKTHCLGTPTSSTTEKKRVESPKRQMQKSVSISGLVKPTQIPQEVCEAEASRDMDMSKSPSINKSVEEAEIAPETPMPRFTSSKKLFESPDSSTNINLDGSRQRSLSEDMRKDTCPGRNQELHLASMDQEQNTVDITNNNPDGEWSSRTRMVAKYLKRNYLIQKQQGKHEILNMLQLAEGKKKKENARLFYDILVLSSKGYVNVKQEEAYGDIILSKLPALDCTGGW